RRHARRDRTLTLAVGRSATSAYFGPRKREELVLCRELFPFELGGFTLFVGCHERAPQEDPESFVERAGLRFECALAIHCGHPHTLHDAYLPATRNGIPLSACFVGTSYQGIGLPRILR